MKKIFLVLALAAAVSAVDMQAQPKNAAAAKAAVDKAAAATTNPKQNTKPATWIKYGKALLDAYNFPKGNAWIGMSRQEFSLVASSDKPVSEQTVNVGERTFTKVSFTNRNYYFSENGLLEIVEVTEPVLADPLGEALKAYKEAARLDTGSKSKKDISEALKSISEKYSEDAYAAYSLGDMSKASVLFENAAEAAGTAPYSTLDTNSVYNAAYTAWAANELERAEKLFNKGIELGYAGSDGDSYAKLADIAEKTERPEAQKSYLEKGFSKYPQSQAILVGLINYYLKSGDDTDRLFELLDEAKKNETTPTVFSSFSTKPRRTSLTMLPFTMSRAISTRSSDISMRQLPHTASALTLILSMNGATSEKESTSTTSQFLSRRRHPTNLTTPSTWRLWASLRTASRPASLLSRKQGCRP